jgi:translation initiation factor IF-2
MIDTPGHKAFYLMRENGASVSDFLLVVIDAIEGIKPQTGLLLLQCLLQVPITIKFFKKYKDSPTQNIRKF